MSTKDETIKEYASHYNQLEDFAKWVAHWIFKEDTPPSTFTELACRKLHKLGIVDLDDGKWTYEEDDE